MFYEEEMDRVLRFGDVLKGFILIEPIVEGPYADKDYTIKVDLESYSVVLSPCCSIGDGVISLSPLLKVREQFYNNPYLEDDLTRINREMKPEQSVSPQRWEKFSLEEQQMRLNEGDAYAFIDLFIYEKHDLLSKYPLKIKKENREISYYMIDFRRIYRVTCKKIESAEKSPIEAKYLQLNVNTRAELRAKISKYYSRIPDEDRIKLEY